MKSSNFLVILFFLPTLLCAQTAKNVEDHQFTINVLLPGMVYEHGVSQNSTITAEATMGFAYRDSDYFGSGFGIYPIGKLQYRHYYNFQRRLDLDKKIAENTGNYIAPTVGLQGGNAILGDLDYSSDFFAVAGAVYGLQRVGNKGLSFRFEVGPAYFFDEFDDDFGLFVAIKLGWVVRKNR